MFSINIGTEKKSTNQVLLYSNNKKKWIDINNCKKKQKYMILYRNEIQEGYKAINYYKIQKKHLPKNLQKQKKFTLQWSCQD